jgi:hypothetical protein
MESENLEILHLELKYCETCGGLWLRQKGSGQVECASCLASPRRRIGKGAGRISHPRMPVARGNEFQTSRRASHRLLKACGRIV